MIATWCPILFPYSTIHRTGSPWLRWQTIQNGVYTLNHRTCLTNHCQLQPSLRQLQVITQRKGRDALIEKKSCGTRSIALRPQPGWAGNKSRTEYLRTPGAMLMREAHLSALEFLDTRGIQETCTL